MYHSVPAGAVSCFGKRSALIALVLIGLLGLISQPASAVNMRALVGDWAIPDTNETLSINGKMEWHHPKYGGARIRRGNNSADIRVFYQGNETKCSYRVSIADRGSTLILASADSRQDSDHCPTGHFKKLGTGTKKKARKYSNYEQ